MRNLKTILWAGAAVAACACVVVVLAQKDGKEPNPKSSAEHPKQTRQIKLRKHAAKQLAEVAGKKTVEREKPTFALDDDDEAKLNEEQRKTIEAIRAALDAEDRPRVLKLVQTLQKSDEWPDGIPKSIKMAAIQALGWFGVSCLPEIAGFLADKDSEVVASATEKFEECLSDPHLSDRERSAILIEASKVIEDPEAMDMMLFYLNDMRHSVAVATIKVLMSGGNEATQAALPANIEFFTGDDTIKSGKDLDDWLKRYPDDEGDEEFYGGLKGTQETP